MNNQGPSFGGDNNVSGDQHIGDKISEGGVKGDHATVNIGSQPIGENELTFAEIIVFISDNFSDEPKNILIDITNSLERISEMNGITPNDVSQTGRIFDQAVTYSYDVSQMLLKTMISIYEEKNSVDETALDINEKMLETLNLYI